MIASAIKDKDEVSKNLYRAIKSEFQKHTTSKNAKPLDEVMEMSIIDKMIKQRNDSYNKYEEAGRQDLADIEIGEITILTDLLPKRPTMEEISMEFDNYCLKEGYTQSTSMGGLTFPKTSIDKKDMGKVMKYLKEKFPLADMKAVSEEIVKPYLN